MKASRPSLLAGQAPDRIDLALKRPALALVMLALSLAVIAPAAAQERTGNDGLKTVNGVWLKLIVKQNASVYDRPDISSTPKPIRQFDFLFALPAAPGTSEKLRNGFYHVAAAAPRTDQQIGWISQSDVIEWPNRQAIGFFRGNWEKHERDRALFYRSFEDLQNVYRGIERKPISGEPSSKAGFLLMPILKEQKVEFRPGTPVSSFQVAYLHARSPVGDTLATSGEGVRNMTLDVAFVIDATGSMRPWIDAAKVVVQNIASIVAADPAGQGRVRFALFCYRDAYPGDQFIARRYCDFSEGADLDAFLRRLGEVQDGGGGDVPERVLDGLMLAINDDTWNELSYKNLIFIGDAPALTSPERAGGLTFEQVLATAQPPQAKYKGITIHALQCVSVAGEDNPDARLCKLQFTGLAAGRSFKGKYGDFKDVNQFIAEVVNFIKERKVYVDAARTGDLSAARELATRDPYAPVPILEQLESDLGPVNTQDPYGVNFASGFVAEVDSKGRKMVEPYVLVRYGQLDKYSAVLGLVLSVVKDLNDPGKVDATKLINNLKTLSIDANLDQDLSAEINKPDPDIGTIMGLLLEVPVQNKIFAVTPSGLRKMTADQFRTFSDQLGNSVSIMKGYLENPNIWFMMGSAKEDRSSRHTFIKVSDLP